MGKISDQLINRNRYKVEVLIALDTYAYEFGDVELTNLLNYWLIKKLNKRMELYDVHR